MRRGYDAKRQERAEWEYQQWLKANDPDHPSNWHPNRLDPEPGFPTEVLE